MFIGYQPVPLAGARSIDRALPVKNAVSAGRTTKTFGVPVVRSTVNVAAGREQPTLPDLAGRLWLSGQTNRASWYWCYLDRLVFELRDAPPALSHP